MRAIGVPRLVDGRPCREVDVDGRQFGRYRLIELLGRGGMGEVWRAHDDETDRVVAVKLLPQHLADDEMFVQRFRREAHAAARLDSPHVIPIHNYGEIEGRLYVDMRLVRGRDLQAVLADGPLAPARAVRIVEQVAKALQAAHEMGLVHRDVKPSNILLDRDDFAYLIDFGIARAAADTKLTGTGGMVGTLQYMAPERLGSGEVDSRADIYALACVLYECLTGSPPFPGDSPERLMMAHLSAPPPRASTARPGVPVRIDAVIAIGMAKDPERRYATTVQLAAAAHDALTVPIPAPPPVVDHPEPVVPTAPVPARFAPPPPAPVDLPTAPVGMSPGTPTLHRSPAPPPSRPVAERRRWWARKSVLVMAALLVVALTAAIVVATTRHSRPSASAGTHTSAPPSTPAAPGYQTQIVLPFTGLGVVQGVAVDGADTLFVADQKQVLRLATDATASQVLPFTSLGVINGVAVDGAGTLYVTDISNHRVLALVAGATTPRVLPFTGLNYPQGVAVDGAGTVYVTDDHNYRVLKLTAGATQQEVLPFTGLDQFSSPAGVAVDAAGTLYVIAGHRVLKLAAGATAQQELAFTTGHYSLAGVAVDGAGAVYVTDYGHGRVLRLAAGATTQQELPFTGLNSPTGVAVDGAGTVYVTDSWNQRVLKLPPK
jgi:serine/threonine protein kinase, bacterial